MLLDKIADLGGSHRAELLRSNIEKFNTTKSTNESIFYSISEINATIENNKKVSFEYFDFNSKREREHRRNGRRYFMNPLAMIYDDDNYYLICYYGRFEGDVQLSLTFFDWGLSFGNNLKVVGLNEVIIMIIAYIQLLTVAYVYS